MSLLTLPTKMTPINRAMGLIWLFFLIVSHQELSSLLPLFGPIMRCNRLLFLTFWLACNGWLQISIRRQNGLSIKLIVDLLRL